MAVLSGGPRGETKSQNNHPGPAVWTFKNRSWTGNDFIKPDMQDQLHQFQQFFCVAVQKAEITDSSKPFGENMLQYELKKVIPFEGFIADFSGFAFRITESNPAVLIGNDIVFTDDAPV